MNFPRHQTPERRGRHSECALSSYGSGRYSLPACRYLLPLALILTANTATFGQTLVDAELTGLGNRLASGARLTVPSQAELKIANGGELTLAAGGALTAEPGSVVDLFHATIALPEALTLKNLRFTGLDNQLPDGASLTLQSGSSLAAEAGSTIDLSAGGVLFPSNVVLTSQSQTLENKTLVAPTVSFMASGSGSDLTLAASGAGATVKLGQGPSGDIFLAPAGNQAAVHLSHDAALQFTSTTGNAPWRVFTASAIAPNSDDQVFYITNNALYNSSTGWWDRDVPGIGAVSFQFESHWTQNNLHNPWFEWNLDFTAPGSGPHTVEDRALAYIRDWTTGQGTWKFRSRDVDKLVIDDTAVTVNDVPLYGGITSGLMLSGSDDPSKGITFRLSRDTVGGFAGTTGDFFVTRGSTKLGPGVFSSNVHAPGELILDNGTSDAPGIHFYTGSNTNFGIDANWRGMRFVADLDENPAAGGVTHLAFLRTGRAGVGTATPASKWEVITESDTSGTPVEFDAKYLTVGQGGADGGNVFISYNGADHIGYIGALTPGIAWRKLVLNPGGGSVYVGASGDATSAGSAAFATAGGVYAAKRIISGSDVVSGANLIASGNISSAGGRFTGGSTGLLLNSSALAQPILFQLDSLEIARFSGTNGNLLIGGSTNIPGNGGLKIFGSTASNSPTSGAFQVTGGVGIGGALNVAQNGYFGGNLLVGGSTDIQGTGGLKVFGATASTSTTSGALQVVGGAGIAGALNVGGSGRFGSKVTIAADIGGGNELQFYGGNNGSHYGTIGIAGSAGAISSNSAVEDVVIRSQAGLRFAAGGAAERLAINPADGAVTIHSTTDSTTTNTGALVVSGGASIKKKAMFGDEVIISPTAAVENIVRFSGSAVPDAFGIWVNDNGTPTVSNAALLATSLSTTLNAPSGGSLTLNIGAATYAQVTSSAATFTVPLRVTNNAASTSTTTGSATFAGGVGVSGRTTTGTLSVGSSSVVDLVVSTVLSLDFPIIAANGGVQDLTIALQGTNIGDAVNVAEAGGAFAPAGVIVRAIVASANTVTVRATNATPVPIDPASTNYRISVISF